MDLQTALKNAVPSSVSIKEAWTLLDAEHHRPIKAFDEAGDPILLYATKEAARAGAAAHDAIWGIDCYPARVFLER